MDKKTVVVEFRSYPENYDKEISGIKPNTLRQVDEADPRFFALRNEGVKTIRISNTKNGEYFEREITDYTEWKGWGIISWKHRE